MHLAVEQEYLLALELLVEVQGRLLVSEQLQVLVVLFLQQVQEACPSASLEYSMFSEVHLALQLSLFQQVAGSAAVLVLFLADPMQKQAVHLVPLVQPSSVKMIHLPALEQVDAEQQKLVVEFLVPGALV